MGHRVAVASANGNFIDTHFGHAQKFYIYELPPGIPVPGGPVAGGPAFLEARVIPPACDKGEHSVEGFEAVAASLRDCAALVVSRIGFGAARFMVGKGFRVFEAPYSPVLASLEKLAADGVLDSPGSSPSNSERREVNF